MFKKSSKARQADRSSAELSGFDQRVYTPSRHPFDSQQPGMPIPRVWQYSKTLELQTSENNRMAPSASNQTHNRAYGNKSHHLSTLDLSQVEEAKGKGFRLFRFKAKEDKKPTPVTTTAISATPSSSYAGNVVFESSHYHPSASSGKRPIPQPYNDYVSLPVSHPSTIDISCPYQSAIPRNISSNYSRTSPIDWNDSQNNPNGHHFSHRNAPPLRMEAELRQKSVSLQQLNSLRPSNEFLPTFLSPSPPALRHAEYGPTQNKGHLSPTILSATAQANFHSDLDSTWSLTSAIPQKHDHSIAAAYPPPNQGGPPTLTLPIECIVGARRLEAASRILLLNSTNEFWRMDLHHLVPMSRGRNLTRLVPDCRDELTDRIQRVILLLEKMQTLLCYTDDEVDLDKLDILDENSSMGDGEQDVDSLTAFSSKSRKSSQHDVPHWSSLSSLSDVETTKMLRILDELVTTMLSLMELTYHSVYSLALKETSWRPATRGIVDRKTLLFAADDIDLSCLRLKLAVQLYKPSSDHLSNSNGSNEMTTSLKHIAGHWSNDQVLTSSCNLLNSALAYLTLCCRTVKQQIQSQHVNLTPSHNNNNILLENGENVAKYPTPRLSSSRESSSDQILPLSSSPHHQFYSFEMDLQSLSLCVHSMSSAAKCVMTAVQCFHRASVAHAESSSSTEIICSQPVFKQRVFSQLIALQSVVAALLDMLAGEWQFVGSPADSLLPITCKSARDTLSGSCLLVVSSCIRLLECITEVDSLFSIPTYTSTLGSFHSLSSFGAMMSTPGTTRPLPTDPQLILDEFKTALFHFQQSVYVHLTSGPHH